MKYYVHCEEMTNSGANFERFAKDTEDEAIQKYHDLMAKCMNPNDIIGCVCTVVVSDGEILVKDAWGTMEKPSAEEVAES